MSSIDAQFEPDRLSAKPTGSVWPRRTCLHPHPGRGETSAREDSGSTSPRPQLVAVDALLRRHAPRFVSRRGVRSVPAFGCRSPAPGMDRTCGSISIGSCPRAADPARLAASSDHPESTRVPRLPMPHRARSEHPRSGCCPRTQYRGWPALEGRVPDVALTRTASQTPWLIRTA